MSFNPDIHITHKDLAESLGVTARKLKGEIISFETPLERAGDANVGGDHVTYYDRTEALEWACLWAQFDAIERAARGECAQTVSKYQGQIVPPRTPPPFKPLELNREMRIAYDRAKVQPPMMTPNGYGDYSRSWGGKEIQP